MLMHTRAQPSEYAKLLTEFFFSRPTTTSEAVINIRSAEKNNRSMILHLSSVFLALSTIEKKKDGITCPCHFFSCGQVETQILA